MQYIIVKGDVGKSDSSCMVEAIQQTSNYMHSSCLNGWQPHIQIVNSVEELKYISLKEV